MAINVPTLYNAAKNGFIAGALGGRLPLSTTAGDYTTLATAAAAFAAQVDSVTGADAQLASGGATLVYSSAVTTAALSNATTTKPATMFAVCLGIMYGRYTTDPVQADYAALAAQAAAAYAAAILNDSLV